MEEEEEEKEGGGGGGEGGGGGGEEEEEEEEEEEVYPNNTAIMNLYVPCSWHGDSLTEPEKLLVFVSVSLSTPRRF
jgi:alkylated DNA repair dioxygenase AlkB